MTGTQGERWQDFSNDQINMLKDIIYKANITTFVIVDMTMWILALNLPVILSYISVVLATNITASVGDLLVSLLLAKLAS